MDQPDLTQSGVEIINALVVPLTLVVVWGLKFLSSKLPASVLLILVPVVGMAVTFGTNYLAGHPIGNPIVGALLGAVATWLHQFISTLKDKGMAPVTSTPLKF